MLRIAIVGCGKIADQHVHAIHRIANCEIVAVCDRELLMAQQLAERFGIPECFSAVEEILRLVKPDVVHITTPPQSHYSIGKQCLEAGSHVYLEKPFTITAGEAESLIGVADARGLKVTTGHNLQFTLEMLEMRRLIKRGFLGGRVVHLESHFSYDLGDRTYARTLLENRNHWVRQLPGKLLHNLLSHGIANLAGFLDDDLTEIVVIADQSPLLRELGEEEIIDELRVLIRDKAGTSAVYCFSTQIKGLNELCVYGPNGSIVVDHSSGSLIRNPNRSYKSYLTYFIPPLVSAREHFRNAGMNIINFGRRKLYQDFGMKELIERFYNSTRSNNPPPIPYREILLTARIMDEIFDRIYPGRVPEVRDQKADSEFVEATAGQEERKTKISGQMSGIGKQFSVITPRTSESALIFAATNLRSDFSHMKYLLITPAHNEERFITKTLDSMVAQTLLPERWIIVDDGSTDRTAEIVGNYVRRYPWMELIQRQQRRDRNFAGKVHAFNAGLERVQSLEFDVIGNLDGDLSFPPDYLDFLMQKFAEDANLGVVGTPFTEDGGYDTAKDSFEGENYVAGGCQLFRRACFEEIGGYVANAAGGIDWIAVTMARMKEWKVRSFPQKRFHHYRTLGTAQQHQLSALFSYGERAYYLGWSPIWQFIRCIYRMTRKPVIAGGMALLLGYYWAAIKRTPRPVTRDVVRFHRREQMARLRAILGRALRLKKIDNFRVERPSVAAPELRSSESVHCGSDS